MKMKRDVEVYKREGLPESWDYAYAQGIGQRIKSKNGMDLKSLDRLERDIGRRGNGAARRGSISN